MLCYNSFCVRIQLCEATLGGCCVFICNLLVRVVHTWRDAFERKGWFVTAFDVTMWVHILYYDSHLSLEQYTSLCWCFSCHADSLSMPIIDFHFKPMLRRFGSRQNLVVPLDSEPILNWVTDFRREPPLLKNIENSIENKGCEYMNAPFDAEFHLILITHLWKRHFKPILCQSNLLNHWTNLIEFHWFQLRIENFVYKLNLLYVMFPTIHCAWQQVDEER